MDSLIYSLSSRSGLSFTNNGFLQKKSALSLTIEELKQEIVEQFMRSNEFLQLVKEKNENYNLTKKDFVYVEIYDDWYYDKKAELLKKTIGFCMAFALL